MTILEVIGLLDLLCTVIFGILGYLRQHRIIEQERFASKFCILTRRGFAVILNVLL